MSLQIWLPLNGNLNNQGLKNITFSLSGSSTGLAVNNSGKIGKCYERTAAAGNSYRSSSTINLDGDITMACWAYVSGTPSGDTANGIVSNHSHGSNTGIGINVKQVSSSDYRISCSTGTGSNRTYCSYYGTTNIKDAWHHLGVTYNKTAKQLQLWVDGNVEYTLSSYVNASKADYIDIFNWSTDIVSSSSYRAICKLNDVRIYDHCLSKREMKELSKGLILHYKLTDAPVNNKIYDCSGFDYHGTVSGSLEISSETAGRYGSSMKWPTATAVGNKIVTPGLTFDGKGFTGAVWVKLTPGSIGGGTYQELLNSSTYYEMSIGNTGYLRAGIHVNNTRYVENCSNPTLYDGNWHHVAITYNGTTINRYVDGIAYASTAITGTAVTTGAFYLGCLSTNSSYWNNNMYESDVRIYATGLSADDIKELYNTGAAIDNAGNSFTYEYIES